MKLPEKPPAKVNLTVRVRPDARDKYLRMSELTKTASKVVSEKLEKFIDELAKDNLAAS
jgi:hypothetical protein